MTYKDYFHNGVFFKDLERCRRGELKPITYNKNGKAVYRNAYWDVDSAALASLWQFPQNKFPVVFCVVYYGQKKCCSIASMVKNRPLLPQIVEKKEGDCLDLSEILGSWRLFRDWLLSDQFIQEFNCAAKEIFPLVLDSIEEGDCKQCIAEHYPHFSKEIQDFFRRVQKGDFRGSIPVFGTHLVDEQNVYPNYTLPKAKGPLAISFNVGNLNELCGRDRIPVNLNINFEDTHVVGTSAEILLYKKFACGEVVKINDNHIVLYTTKGFFRDEKSTSEWLKKNIEFSVFLPDKGLKCYDLETAIERDSINANIVRGSSHNFYDVLLVDFVYQLRVLNVPNTPVLDDLCSPFVFRFSKRSDRDESWCYMRYFQAIRAVCEYGDKVLNNDEQGYILKRPENLKELLPFFRMNCKLEYEDLLGMIDGGEKVFENYSGPNIRKKKRRFLEKCLCEQIVANPDLYITSEIPEIRKVVRTFLNKE